MARLGIYDPSKAIDPTWLSKTLKNIFNLPVTLTEIERSQAITIYRLKSYN